jgi:uncharacterized protein (DUF58 family)
MEFRDFRAYVPGDDLRRLDWNLYRRSGRLFLKLFEETQDLPVYILLDVSDSMFFETPSRADPARQMAACLAAVGTNQMDRVGVYPFGADLVQPLASAGGQHGFHRVLDYLEQLRPAGPTDVRQAIRRFSGLRLRAGLTVVISDFFDPAGIDSVLETLRSLPHRLAVIQLVRASDGDPRLQGEYRFVDCESGGGTNVTVTAAALERYRQAYRTFDEKLLNFVVRRRAAHMKLDADRPVVEQLGRLFVDGTLSV